MNQKNNSKFM